MLGVCFLRFLFHSMLFVCSVLRLACYVLFWLFVWLCSVLRLVGCLFVCLFVVLVADVVVVCCCCLCVFFFLLMYAPLCVVLMGGCLFACSLVCC